MSSFRSFLLGALLGVASALPASAARLTLQWEDKSQDEDGFRVERALGTGPFGLVAILPRNQTSYVDSALTPQASYRYRVSAFNGAGTSPPSNTATGIAGAADQAPVLGAVADLAIGAAGALVPLTVSDRETAVDRLEVIAASSDPSVLTASIVSSAAGPGPHRVQLTPVPGAAGAVVVTVAASDGENVVYQRFTVQVGDGIRVASDATARDDSGGSRLVNLSARGLTGDGATMLILGFSTTGDGTSLLLRAIGPGLRTFGVREVVDDPRLLLYRGSQVVASNQNWGGSLALVDVFARAGAFPLFRWSLDAALHQRLSAGGYAAHVALESGRPGIALAELHATDAGAPGEGRLVNLSARGWVGQGSEAMHLGFSIRGDVPLTLLIRSVGNGLQRLGLTGVLTQPRLELYQEGRVVQQIRSWAFAPALIDATQRVGAFPLLDRGDAAALVTLEPGTYTVVVSSANGAGGINLAEIYEVPSLR